MSASGSGSDDGQLISEWARMIKSEDELNCMRWAVAVAEHGIRHMEQAIRPGVSELQLWALLNYCNLANDGDWHDGRMLASGDRINPWLQEASPRRLEAGDFMALIPTWLALWLLCRHQPHHVLRARLAKQTSERLYRLAHAEVMHNMSILKLVSRSKNSAAKPLSKMKSTGQAYTCLVHAVGMCDEAPQLKHSFRGPQPYAGTFEEGMVICVESYVGEVGERDGVKLEQQVLVTKEGCEPMSTYPWDARLLD